ncbi:squalene synthase [Malassezia cuniculi]|uniref:Squalene synthase n=1 Tax=Malassezia cuniculi TaxID=948313 RepID=A0AAF0EY86_9BASI|nr:squalene synthase [Malassezia cuniculi]
MSASSLLVTALTHPRELRAMITYKVWRDPVHDIRRHPETSGWDRERMRECWAFLDATSRSFAAVIKELKGELSRVICIFYLVLRALDTIEDDMTIPASVKIPLLVDFYKKLNEPGWNFTESGPNEKDRQLLVEFDKVIEEYQLLSEGCRIVIADICARMGAGMASYIELGNSPGGLRMQKWADYDLYCHFVAGLVGEGLSGLFSETEIERSSVGLQLTLSNHMGLFLQKTNIIRDYAEDSAEGRFFWPKECWGVGDVFGSQGDVQKGVVETRPGSNNWTFADNLEGRTAQRILSSMLLDAMSHAVNSLEYLSMLRDQSVFNFCAIPQVMAISTLDLMVNNANVFKKNVKIRKSLAVTLILGAVNPRDVGLTFVQYARSIHAKLSPADPNYVRWCVELGRIELWTESHFPSFIQVKGGKSKDVRAEMFEKWVVTNDRLARPEHYMSAANREEYEKFMRNNPQRVRAQRAEQFKMKLVVAGVIVSVITFMLTLTTVAFSIMWFFIGDTENPLLTLARNLFVSLRDTGLRNTIMNGVNIIEASFEQRDWAK